jgi:hypothetical protein
MNLKKYILIDVIDGETIKVKVINGFLRSELQDTFDLTTIWQPLGQGADKLFFLPGCSVPRFKVREHFACTIKPEYATAAFVSKQGLVGSDSTLDHYRDVYPIRKEYMFDFMNNLKDHHTTLLWDSLTEDLEDDAIIYITKNLWYTYSHSGEYTNYGENIDEGMIQMDIRKWSFKYQASASEYQLFGITRKSGINNLQCDIYFEDDILGHLNVGNLVVGEEKYHELRSFGQTEEKENIVLMMELMSNADFKESLVYLLFLLKEFGHSIYPLKESNHVNFKSLLSYLTLGHEDLADLNLIKMTKVLRQHKKFTRDIAFQLSTLFTGEKIHYTDPENIYYTEGPVLKPNFINLLNKEDDSN